VTPANARRGAQAVDPPTAEELAELAQAEAEGAPRIILRDLRGMATASDLAQRSQTSVVAGLSGFSTLIQVRAGPSGRAHRVATRRSRRTRYEPYPSGNAHRAASNDVEFVWELLIPWRRYPAARNSVMCFSQ
jgi:hypothetical protein